MYKALFFTLDDKNAVTFAGKRQSKDIKVAQKMCEFMSGTPLAIKAKSANFFEGVDIPLVTVDNFVDCREDTPTAFCEEIPSQEVLDNALVLIVFRWNRNYPSLTNERLNLDGYSKTFVEEFAGNSHEKITVEVYNK